ETELERLALDEVAIAHPLHSSFDHDLRGTVRSRPAHPVVDEHRPLLFTGLTRRGPAASMRRSREKKANGRGDWVWTSDLLLPKQARYQAALRPVPFQRCRRPTARDAPSSTVNHPTRISPPTSRTRNRHARSCASRRSSSRSDATPAWWLRRPASPCT